MKTYEWDDEKYDANITRHRIAFEIIANAKWQVSFLIETHWIDGEERHVEVVPIDSGLYTVVTTDRVDAIRLISLRRASNYEKKLWRTEYHHG